MLSSCQTCPHLTGSLRLVLRCWCTTHSLADCSKVLALAFSLWQGENQKKKESIVRSLTSVSKPLFIKEDWTSCSRGPEGEKVKSFLLFGFHSDVYYIFGKTCRDAGRVAHKHIGRQRHQKLEQLWGHLIAIKFDDKVNDYQVVI